MESAVSIGIASAAYDAASHRGDWPLALQLGQRLAAALPRHPWVLSSLALTLHNYGNAVPAAGGGSRFLVRNSLERTRLHLQALALLDSSAAVSETPSDRASALIWKARIEVAEGLPLDALASYREAFTLAPSSPTLLAGIDTLRTRLATFEADAGSVVR